MYITSRCDRDVSSTTHKTLLHTTRLLSKSKGLDARTLSQSILNDATLMMSKTPLRAFPQHHLQLSADIVRQLSTIRASRQESFFF